jgi:hypothetical protein
MAPALASGEIIKKGTAVVMVFRSPPPSWVGVIWARRDVPIPPKSSETRTKVKKPVQRKSREWELQGMFRGCEIR